MAILPVALVKIPPQRAENILIYFVKTEMSYMLLPLNECFIALALQSLTMFFSAMFWFVISDAAQHIPVCTN